MYELIQVSERRHARSVFNLNKALIDFKMPARQKILDIVLRSEYNGYSRSWSVNPNMILQVILL